MAAALLRPWGQGRGEGDTGVGLGTVPRPAARDRGECRSLGCACGRVCEPVRLQACLPVPPESQEAGLSPGGGGAAPAPQAKLWGLL